LPAARWQPRCIASTTESRRWNRAWPQLGPIRGCFRQRETCCSATVRSDRPDFIPTRCFSAIRAWLLGLGTCLGSGCCGCHVTKSSGNCRCTLIVWLSSVADAAHHPQLGSTRPAHLPAQRPGVALRGVASLASGIILRIGANRRSPLRFPPSYLKWRAIL